MLVKWVIPFLVGLIIFFIIGWVTGTDEYSGVKTKDDERSQLIKQKAIVSSWLLLLGFFVINFIFDFLHLNDERLALVQFKYPELLYLLIAMLSYFVYYWMYSRRMSVHEK
ncbi:hypothetical protein M3215_18940 [Bacillus cytotoxicus]|uniref:Uncharacterized protein n=1 Tax=Bacillus cytotoxicus TaxID=580165 RepID=A0ACC6AB57_9BACI|nr:hypothetical protein [Bacillus cytotoxicus]